jgi:sugar (pentulose or hexulose) kinase
MSGKHVAVIDIGKTNAKLALVALPDLREVAVLTRLNTVIPGPPYPHFDVEGHWTFLLEGLTQFQATHDIAAITVTTHGAAAALLTEDGTLAAPILDYEFDGIDAVSDLYAAIRPPFSETGSPSLAMGLNLGAQLHWQFHNDPTLHDRVDNVVTYPQFWGHRLTGTPATDVTSLGCHTDLWQPLTARFSSLVTALGLADKIAPVRKPGDVLGWLREDVSQRTGISADTPVFCGIHDSNASLLPHLLSRSAPFSVVSTGTWVIAMSVGGKPISLDPGRDTLINVNAFGQPILSARFMGGREYDTALQGTQAPFEESDILDVLTREIMLLPAIVQDTGPFRGREAEWIGPEPPMGSPNRSVAVGYYLALVTSRCLELVGHRGDVIVEGPFAQNAAFLTMLQHATASNVLSMDSATGTSEGAALTTGLAHQFNLNPRRTPNLPSAEPFFGRYVAKWKRLCGL